jgi:hypothetical protein
LKDFEKKMCSLRHHVTITKEQARKQKLQYIQVRDLFLDIEEEFPRVYSSKVIVSIPKVKYPNIEICQILDYLVKATPKKISDYYVLQSIGVEDGMWIFKYDKRILQVSVRARRK